MSKICIDPGHGGSDPGAIGPGGTKEKDITLAVALKVGEKLKANGLEVVFTRANDNPGFPQDQRQNLAKRVSIANMAKVDLFVSIHCNSAVDQQAHGTETYYYKLGYNGEKLARAIQDEMLKATGLYNRGVKTANFYVIKYTQMPAALVEMAFISNPAEEKLLASIEFQEKAVTAIAKGICNYAGIEYQELPPNLSPWAKEAWIWGVEKGIIDGSRPKGTITREEVITMIYRAIKNLQEG
ncbi:N-acetylmuramoyl-L-alanine amidase family protein [Calorimonas adulescens]|uniref:N-acetylmuramoyl-L-alanine amidase n=1 Tax=Calorimonas adulescens TaxID=2606906 RepID=A0A5D8QD21_9THEO|nr:N-acetylmuramoyl-L-alanine amidase [Calorimonas adulescens]TZE82014.1 N-acetylmuramoyl-L-alanine amidase [Calorimonas adulescens]